MEINEQIGRVIRQRRTILGLSQGKVAEKMGVSCQQVQKYEKGFNGLSVEKLIDVGKALQCHPADIIYQIMGYIEIRSGQRRDLEMMKRFRMLRDYEQNALVAFLNKLIAGKNEAKN